MSAEREVVCATGLTVIVREMTGAEIQALKSSRDTSDDGGYLVNQCLVRVVDRGQLYQWPAGQLIVDDLMMSDLTEILIGIRCATFGAEFTFACVCPYCNEGNEYTASVDALEHRPMDPEAIARLTEKRPFETSVNGTIVKWLPATRRARNTMTKLAKLDPEKEYALGASLRVVEIAGVHPNDHLTWLSKLGVGLARNFAELMDYFEGGVNDSLELRCLGCQAVFVGGVPLDRKFWEPPKAAWKRRGTRPDPSAIG